MESIQKLSALLKEYFGFSYAMISKAPEVRISIIFGGAAPVSGPAEFVVRESPFKIPIEPVRHEKQMLLTSRYRRSATNQYWLSGVLIYVSKKEAEKQYSTPAMLEFLELSWGNLHQGREFAAHLYVDGMKRLVVGKVCRQYLPTHTFFNPIETASRAVITREPPMQLKVVQAAE